MNPIGIQYLYWNEPDVYRAAELTQQAEADVFECGTTVVHGMASCERKRLARQLADMDLTLTLNGGMPGADPSSPDAEVRERSVRLCCEAVEAAADAGSQIWGGIIYTRWMGLPLIPFTAQDRKDMWQRGVESMSKVMRVAEREGVDVCFEVVNRFEGYLVTTAEQGVRFTEDIGSSRAKLLLDTFHMHIEEDSISEALAAAMAHGRLGHVHAGEHNRHLPGFGKTQMNWAEILGTLEQCGYQGVITLEPLVSADTPNAGTYRVWRNLLQDTSQPELLEAARQSIAHLRSKM